MALIKKSNDVSLEKRQIADAIRTRYPHLDRAQSERLADEVVRQIVRALREGKDLATFARHANGDVEVNLFTLVDDVVQQSGTA